MYLAKLCGASLARGLNTSWYDHAIVNKAASWVAGCVESPVDDRVRWPLTAAVSDLSNEEYVREFH